MAEAIRYCKTRDGAQIAYRVRGEGEPLIASPSFMSINYTLPDWRIGLYEELARHFKLVTYDGRGTGLSRNSAATYSLDERVEDLHAVAHAVDAERFRLVAQLYGTPTSMAFAARHPGRVERLVLFQAYADGADFYARGAFGQVVDALRDITVDQWEFASRATIMRGALPGTPADILEKRAASFREAWTPEGILAFREQNKRTNVTAELRKIQAPTLLVHAETGSTPPLTLELAQQVVSSIPDAHLLNTSIQWDALPPETVAEILDFFGARTSGRAPIYGEVSGVRTVLFTDLVGHTEMMQRLGDERGRDVLREHERITRDLLKQHGGAEVKTTGDGFMASFASVTKAMDCAIALQRALATIKFPPPLDGEGLGVRCGLNAGEPIEEDGDLFGSTVIMASRIAAQAGPGEILIPEPLRHLLTGKSYVYADRGETMLKGFEDAVRLYEVRWRE